MPMPSMDTNAPASREALMDALTPPVTENVTHPQDVTESVTLPSNDLSQALAILTHIRDGGSLQSAATALKISPSTAYRRLNLIEEDDNGVVKLLKVNGLRLANDLLRASEVAAGKGDHRPALAGLLHGKSIEPVNEGNQGVQVAIVIGTPEQPIRIQPPQVIEG